MPIRCINKKSVNVKNVITMWKHRIINNIQNSIKYNFTFGVSIINETNYVLGCIVRGHQKGLKSGLSLNTS